MITSPNQQEDNLLSHVLRQRITVNWELAAYVAIFLLALFSRFAILDQRVMSHDESLHTRFSYDLYKDGNFTHTPLMHGPVLFHATALSFSLFGDSDFSGRIYTAVLGVMMVMFPLLWRKWLGRYGALLASIMLLISPLILYYNRYIRHDTPSIFFGMVMAYCILIYIDGSPRFRRRPLWLYLFSAALILNLGSKETAFIYIAIFGSFLTFFFLVRLLQARYSIRGAPLFHSVLLGILVGGVITMGMYIVVDIIPAEILPGRGTALSELSDIERSSWISWMLLSILSGVFLLLSTAVYAFRDKLARIPWRELLLILLLALLTAGGLLYIEELSHFPQPTETAVPANPSAEVPAEATSGESIRSMPALALCFVFVVVAFLLWRDARRSRGTSDDKTRGGLWGALHAYPEVDFLVLLFTLVLPWLTALFTRMMGGSSSAFIQLAESAPTGIVSIVQSLPGLGGSEQVGQFMVGAAVFLPLALLSLSIGLSWHWKRWTICAVLFHALFAFFFTSAFTNIAGLGTGMIYSLGYWLEQQGVRRGSQPQYYYLFIILPTYEFLPVVGSISAMLAGVTAFWQRRRKRIVIAEQHQAQIAELGELESDAPTRAAPAPTEEDQLRALPFSLLLAWWAVLNLIGYTLAGEKMPWLGTHLSTPMILLAAWYFGGVFSRISRRQFVAGGWLALCLLPLWIISAAQVFGAFLFGDPPLMGLERAQLEHSYEWLGALALLLASSYVLYRVARHSSWRHVRRLFALALFGLLSLFTLRAAWMASFINYDLPTEFLVYAHAGPSVKWVLDDITELSQRTTGGMQMKFAYDNEVSWPYSWYFRNFDQAVFVGSNPTLQNTEDAVVVVVGSANRGKIEPILEDRYLRQEYIRMWWPMQSYFNLSAERLLNVLDFSPGNQAAAELRRGIFDIWWARDFDRYEQATGENFSLESWPVSDRMHVYIRRDFAAKIWEYGLGEGEVLSEISPEINQCAANWRALSPLLTFEAPPQPMNNPLALHSAGERIIVADEFGNRVHVYTRDGVYETSYGGTEQVELNRPNSAVSLGDGELLIVDTWNYRILHLDAAGEPLSSWGSPGEFGFNAAREPVDSFWGPRDIVLNRQGHVYISDTGNKRIRVYSLENGLAEHLYDIGSGGSGPGELDEPSGLELHSDGRLFVANTWNRRVSVYDATGAHLSDFPVRGWYNVSFNRPYLALDEARDQLYITDPDSKRILVVNSAGECLGSFGESGEFGEHGQFQDIGGIAVDADGQVYISDSVAGQVRKFAPFVSG